MNIVNPLYNEFTAAEYLGGTVAPISVRTLQRWRLEGGGPSFIKLGRLVRYRQSDLDNFIQHSRRSSTSGQLSEGV